MFNMAAMANRRRGVAAGPVGVPACVRNRPHAVPGRSWGRRHAAVCLCVTGARCVGGRVRALGRGRATAAIVAHAHRSAAPQPGRPAGEPDRYADPTPHRHAGKGICPVLHTRASDVCLCVVIGGRSYSALGGRQWTPCTAWGQHCVAPTAKFCSSWTVNTSTHTFHTPTQTRTTDQAFHLDV
jgi:hypothetical protein